MTNTEIKAELVRLRKERITQRQLAKRLGTSQSALSQFENDANDPKLSTLVRYAEALNLRLVIIEDV